MDVLFAKLGRATPIDAHDMGRFLDQLPGASGVEVAGVLGALLGRHDDEDAAKFVSAIRERLVVQRIEGSVDQPTINIVGTGGGPSTFNISTSTSFVLAAAGLKVIKTGSTAWRSRSGFMEVATALGCLEEQMTWEQVMEVADEVGICFAAPNLYPTALREASDAVGSRKLFRQVGYYINIIGPLLSPVAPDFRVVGASSRARQDLLVSALTRLGDVPATVVWAENDLDEVSPLGKTRLVHIDKHGEQREEIIDAEALPLTPVTMDDLAGFGPIKAAKLIRRVLSGEGTAQQREVVALNAAVVLHSLGFKSVELAFKFGLDLIASGAPYEKMEALSAALSRL